MASALIGVRVTRCAARAATIRPLPAGDVATPAWLGMVIYTEYLLPVRDRRA